MLDALLDAAFKRSAHRTMRLGPSEGIGAVPAKPVFLYLHVPFCEVLCPYCSFHRVRYEEPKARRYFAALRDEVRRYHERGYAFSGVYVGGGTPTILPGELAETLALVRELNPGLREASVETSPKDLRDDVLGMLQSVGVNRLSVGVQTFDDGLLREMVRLEKYGGRDEILARLAIAAGRFETLNIDLIWNLPHQTPGMLESDLETLIACPASQASFYPLMNAPSVERKMKKALGLPGREHLHEFYERILARLQGSFVPTSAWCFTRGHKSIDEYIVDAADYVGLGSGAFSYLDGTLYATTFSLQVYSERIARGLTGITGERCLGSRERMRYDLLVHLFSLRLEKAWVRARYGDRFEREMGPELFALEFLGYVTEDERGWALTQRGMYLWVRMMSAFFESVDALREEMRSHVLAELEDPSAGIYLVPLAEIRHGPAGLRRAR